MVKVLFKASFIKDKRKIQKEQKLFSPDEAGQ